MIIITVENIRSQLSDYVEGLEESLSCFHQGYFFAPTYRNHLWDGKTHFLKIPSLKFPTGLLFMVEEFFKTNNVEYKIRDQRRRPVTYLCPPNSLIHEDKCILNGIELRDYQIEAIKECLEKEHGVLELPTGSGKTEIAAALIELTRTETLFLVHTQDLLRQTKKRFEERTHLGIGCTGDGQFDVENKRIIVATVQSLNSRLDREEKWTKDFLDTFHMLFLDECHHASANSWYKIGSLCRNAYFRFGLSGSILRRDVLSNMKMLAIFGAPIYRLPTMELVEKGYLSNISVELIDNDEFAAFDTKLMTWADIYNMGVVRSVKRNKQIVDIAEKHFSDGKRVMILVRKIEHGVILEGMFQEHRVPVIFLSGKDSSELRERIKETYSRECDVPVLIASTIFNEGVDLPEVNVIIIAAGGKSEVQTIQRVGRGLRLKKNENELILYDFIDYGKFLSRHSKARIKVYKHEGFIK